MMHVLVVTHLFGCVEIETIAVFLSCTKETEPGAHCLALKPLVSRLRYASQVIQYDPNYLCPGKYRPFKDSQGNTATSTYNNIMLILPLPLCGLYSIHAQNGYGQYRPCKIVLLTLVAPRGVTDLYLS